MSYREVNINEVIDLLGLAVEPGTNRDTSYLIRCPFCGDDGKRKKKMSIDPNMYTHGVYSCCRCGEMGGALDLYSKLVLGRPAGAARSESNKEAFAHLITALEKQQPPTRTNVQTNATNGKKSSQILPASDRVLNEVYKALLSFPEFELSELHRENLTKRGMSETAITRNFYRTIPENIGTILQFYPDIVKKYDKENIDDLRRENSLLRYYPRERMILSMIVGDYIVRRGIIPRKVPGFFTLKGYWFVRCDAGMLVPTRNMYGDIVALQIRKDRGDVRYMTLSSKGLPDGVTNNISRAHFPLRNARLAPNAQVLVTEGPLKADVAMEVLGNKYAMIALHGVQNRRDVPQTFRYLKRRGVQTVRLAFDMDRTLNPSVLKAGKWLKEMAKVNHIKMVDLYWDEPFAQERLKELKGYFHLNGMEEPEHNNVFLKLSLMTWTLYQKGVKMPKEYSRWRDETKGIDDWLQFQKNHTSVAKKPH